MANKKAHTPTVQNNERETFISLYRSYHKRMCLFAMKFVRNQQSAEDIIQEVFISLWERENKFNFDDTIQIERYLFKAVYNNCITLLKRNRNKQDHHERLMLELMTCSTDIEEHMLSKELHERINIINKDLPEKSREIFRLSREEGMKNKDIALKLKLTEKSIEYHITKTLKLFREKLVDYIYLFIFLIHFFPKN